jgi:hypothetical protein
MLFYCARNGYSRIFTVFFGCVYLPIIGNLLSFDAGAFYRNLKPVLGNIEGTDFSTRHDFCVG